MIRAVDGELIDEGPGEAALPSPSDLDALFRTEGDGVYRTLYAFTGGRVDVAEEATAEAFARAVAQGDALRDPIAWIIESRSASRSTSCEPTDVVVRGSMSRSSLRSWRA